MIKSYGLWSEQRGTSNRAVIIVDKNGVIRFRREYPLPSPPNPADILAEVEKLG